MKHCTKCAKKWRICQKRMPHEITKHWRSGEHK